MNISDENMESFVNQSNETVPQEKPAKRAKKSIRAAKHVQVKYLTRSRFRIPDTSAKSKSLLECPNNCGSSFFHKHTLQRHLKIICGQPLRYKCPYCDMSARLRSNLNTHIKARHPEFKNYVIDMWTGKAEPRFEEDFGSPHVDQAEASWNEEHEIKILSVSSLAKVEDIKHEYQGLQDDAFVEHKRYVCPNNCGNSYKHEHTLNVHMEFGCNRDEETNFHLDDDESDSEYDASTMEHSKGKNPDELLNPMAIGEMSNLQQNDEGKWVCPNKCGGTFSSRSNLNYHIRTHCGLEPKLECPYCFHRMKQPSNGFVHVKNHHPGLKVCLVNVDTGEVLRRRSDSDVINYNLNNGPSEVVTEGKEPSVKSETTCNNCGKEFKFKSTLSRHISEGCGFPKRFKCPYCEYRVRRLSYAFFHVSKNHPGCEVYMVDLVTGDSITDPAQIKKEAICEMVEDQKPFLSPPVVAPQPKKTEKPRHQKKKLVCPKGCGHYFFFKPSLQKHVKHCKRNRRGLPSADACRFKCPYCEHCYEHRSSIFRHIKARHHKLRKYAIDTHEEEIVPEIASQEETKVFKAKKLPKQQSVEVDEKTEENTNSEDGVKTFECPNKCGGTFKHYLNVKRHVRLSCVKARRYKCPQCNYRSLKFQLIVKHIKSNHRMNKIYAIDIFTKKMVYSEPRRRPRSLRNKTEEKEPEDVKPAIKPVVKPAAAEKVVRTLPKTTAKRHKIPQRYPCPNNCGSSFSLERSVETHLKHICGKAPRYKCPYCPQICRHQGNMTIHIKYRHPGKRNYVIDTLKRKPKRRLKKEEDNSEDQVEDVANNIKVEEDNQNNQGEASSALTPKAKRKTGKLFNTFRRRRIKCPHNCGSVFRSDEKLKTHIQTVCKKPLIFKCPYCSKICKYSWNIDMHVKHRHPEHLKTKVKVKKEPKDSKNLKSEQKMKLRDNVKRELEEDDSKDDLQPAENDANKTEEVEEYNETEDFEMKLVDEDENIEQEEDQVDDAQIELESSPSANVSSNDDNLKPISPSRKFPCPNNCGNSYTKESSLKNHLKYTCQKPERFKCPYCDNRTKQTSNGYAHVKKFHPDQQIYLIDIETNKIVCGSRGHPLKLTQGMTENEDLENTEVDENMDISEGAIATENAEIMNDSNDYMDEADEPDEPIVGTEEEFTGGPVALETFNDKEEIFPCPNNCGSSFTHEHKLTNHLRDQCGPPRYKCPYCFYITRQPSNVYTHIKNKHPDERIYLIDTDMNQSYNEPGSPPGNEDN